MKKRLSLAIDPVRARAANKYHGDPHSPNLAPDSPLIERPFLPSQQEAELKRVCTLVLAGIQSSDDDMVVPPPALADMIPMEPTPLRHKHSSFIFPLSQPSALTASSLTTTRTRDTLKRGDSYELPAAFEPLEPAHTRATKQSDKSFSDHDNIILWEIRNGLELRPKTATSTSVDLNGLETSPSSIPSQRTNSSTPCTSAGVSLGDASKRTSQVPMEAKLASTTISSSDINDPFLANGMPNGQATSTSVEHLETASQEQQEGQSPKSQRKSRPIRLSQRSENWSSYLNKSIDAPSSSNSMHSVESGNSPSTNQWPTFESRYTSRDRGSGPGRFDTDDDDEYILPADDLSLNRQLSAMSGLSSHGPRARHSAMLLRNPRDRLSVVIDGDGLEKVLSEEEGKQRQEDLARAVQEKMSRGSIIGSVPASPSTYTSGRGTSIDSQLHRITTAGSTHPPGGFPVHKHPGLAAEVVIEEADPVPSITIPKSKPSKGGFMKRLGSKLGVGKRGKGLAMA